MGWGKARFDLVVVCGGGCGGEDVKDGGEEDEAEHEDYMDNGQVYCH